MGLSRIELVVTMVGLVSLLVFSSAFASGGDKTVSVVVMNPSTGAVIGSASRTVTVQNVGSCDGSGSGGEYFVLQSAYAHGSEGSLFLHEMELYNQSSLEASIRIDWLPRGQNNSVPPLSSVYLVPGQTPIRVANALDEFFGLEPDVAGSLRITPLSGSVEFSNLVLNTGDVGDFGWVTPAGNVEDGLAQNEEGFIIHLSENDDIRSNLACVNMVDDNLPIVIESFDSFGTLLETQTMILAPFSTNQINRIFADYAPIDGFIKVSSIKVGSRFFCAGYVLGNLSNDPRQAPLQKGANPEQTYYLPRAVHGGAGTTDLSLFSPAGGAVVSIALLPTGQDNSSYLTANFSVPGGEEIRLPSILDSVFGYHGTAALRLETISGELVAAASESTAPTGTFIHRSASVRPIGEETPSNIQAAIIHLTENVDRRTDIGVANTSGVTIDVTIDLRNNLGSHLGTHRLQVLPYSHLQIDSVFSSLGHSDVPDGMARIMTLTPGGSFFAYAIVTELNTLDSWEMISFPLPFELFSNGFETGDTSAWSDTTP